jgi:hypothetical protein
VISDLPEEAPLILARFGISRTANITAVVGGHINRSWRVVPSSEDKAAGTATRNLEPGTPSLLLQRVNPQVFPDGGVVMQNMAAVCDHLQRAARRLGLSQPERRVLRLLRTLGGDVAVQGSDGAWWRLVEFIEDTQVIEQARSPAEAREAGLAFGLFQRLLADYAGSPLAETIPGFHDTALRIARLEAAALRDDRGRRREVAAELGFALGRRGHADVLPPLVASGALPRRVVHNDAKIGNVLLDARTGEGLAVIDLDTVMPGTLLSDVGDLLRSIASATAEDEPDLARIEVSRPLVEALMSGFLEACGGALTEAERGLLVFSGILLAYEQGVRFLTDYLEGDVYYRTAHPGHNLDRARAQLRLVELLEGERGRLEKLVAEIVRRET